jgi:hypothetical protein
MAVLFSRELLFCSLALLLLACSERDAVDPTPTSAAAVEYSGPGTLHAVQATTQLHLRGVAIGVGNIWEEEYRTAGGESRNGLTAGLFISVRDDPSQNRRIRVHPGQEVSVPGHLLHVVAVEERVVHLAVIDQGQ